MNARIPIPELRCRAIKRNGKVCGHKWLPRKPGADPDECPKCKSRLWRGKKKP
ncbi:hypothetical protein LCGC14_1579140 [marine sediment metagenome]|uniref:Uncharacterized protein n=1 Tax=marine sediment metagenome TaxID=412755 RepID=A0A0F9IHL2_9ZZZZ